MEIIIVAVAILAVAGYFILRKGKDIPEIVVKTEQAQPVVEEVKPAEPVVPAEPATPTFVPTVTQEVKEFVEEAKATLDVNDDGKVNLADATEVVKKATTKAKTAVAKAKKKK
jgi:hypothetical protein